MADIAVDVWMFAIMCECYAVLQRSLTGHCLEKRSINAIPLPFKIRSGLVGWRKKVYRDIYIKSHKDLKRRPFFLYCGSLKHLQERKAMYTGGHILKYQTESKQVSHSDRENGSCIGETTQRRAIYSYVSQREVKILRVVLDSLLSARFQVLLWDCESRKRIYFCVSRFRGIIIHVIWTTSI